MGVPTFAHPCCQAFALPQFKDKQRSQPTPSDYIQPITIHYIYSNSWDIIYPRRRFVALKSCELNQSCEV